MFKSLTKVYLFVHPSQMYRKPRTRVDIAVLAFRWFVSIMYCLQFTLGRYSKKLKHRTGRRVICIKALKAVFWLGVRTKLNKTDFDEYTKCASFIENGRIWLRQNGSGPITLDLSIRAYLPPFHVIYIHTGTYRSVQILTYCTLTHRREYVIFSRLYG